MNLLHQDDHPCIYMFLLLIPLRINFCWFKFWIHDKDLNLFFYLSFELANLLLFDLEFWGLDLVLILAERFNLCAFPMTAFRETPPGIWAISDAITFHNSLSFSTFFCPTLSTYSIFNIQYRVTHNDKTSIF